MQERLYIENHSHLPSPGDRDICGCSPKRVTWRFPCGPLRGLCAAADVQNTWSWCLLAAWLPPLKVRCVKRDAELGISCTRSSWIHSHPQGLLCTHF